MKYNYLFVSPIAPNVSSQIKSQNAKTSEYQSKGVMGSSAGGAVSVASLSGPLAANGKFLWRADATWLRSPAAV